ncbi:MAG: enoyl-CoA hydratase/isomerase family protein, partial [Myxococcales bacterium]|nr:enoyl-CoA hydratase/isomerase family protein [Myxococcales bacterium]
DPAVRVIVLTGAGEAFTAGNDVIDFMSKLPKKAEDSPTVRFMRSVFECEKPLIAAVNGVAVGVGVTMLLHCDLVYVAAGSQLKMPFTKLALCPELVSSYLLPRMIGMPRAMEMLLLGDAISAERAVEWGLANEVLAAEAVLPRALERARQIAALPPGSVRDTKRLMRAPWRDLGDQVFWDELTTLSARLGSPEVSEAVTAFFQKREPDFSRFA